MVNFCCLVAQSRPALFATPMDCNLPSSSVHEILQARILEWVAISFSRGSSWPRDRTCISCISGGFFTDWATGEDFMVNISVSVYVCMCVCLHTGNSNVYVHAYACIYIYTHTLISGLILMFLHPTFSIRFTYHFAEVHPLGLLSVKALGYKFSSLCKSDRGFILF